MRGAVAVARYSLISTGSTWPVASAKAVGPERPRPAAHSPRALWVLQPRCHHQPSHISHLGHFGCDSARRTSYCLAPAGAAASAWKCRRAAARRSPFASYSHSRRIASGSIPSCWSASTLFLRQCEQRPNSYTSRSAGAAVATGYFSKRSSTPKRHTRPPLLDQMRRRAPAVLPDRPVVRSGGAVRKSARGGTSRQAGADLIVTLPERTGGTCQPNCLENVVFVPFFNLPI